VEFEGVRNFDRAKIWAGAGQGGHVGEFVFVNLNERAAPLLEFLGRVPELVAPLHLGKKLKYFDRCFLHADCIGRCTWIIISMAGTTFRMRTKG